MTIIKTDEKWYRAEQTIKNGILTYTVKAYSSTHAKAIDECLKKIK